MKKLIIVISLLLVVFFVISFFFRILGEKIGGFDFIDEIDKIVDSYKRIEVPTEGMNSYMPITSPAFSNFSYPNEYKLFGCINGTLKYDDSYYFEQYGSNYKFDGNEFLYSPIAEGLSFFKGVSLTEGNPTHVVAEFDVLDLDTSNQNLGCSLYLLSGLSFDLDNDFPKSLLYSSLGVDFVPSDAGYVLTTYNGKKIEGKEFHIEYIFEINPEDCSSSRLQIVVNDVVYKDSYRSDVPLFESSVDTLYGFSVCKFNAQTTPSEITFRNIVVKTNAVSNIVPVSDSNLE